MAKLAKIMDISLKHRCIVTTRDNTSVVQSVSRCNIINKHSRMRAIVTSSKTSGVQDVSRFARINNHSRMRDIVTNRGNKYVVQGVAKFIRINKQTRMRAIVTSCNTSGVHHAARFIRINRYLHPGLRRSVF